MIKVFILSIILCGTARAEIPDCQAVRVILGEAGNQGKIGMLACADALRNRGTVKGCYGLNNPIVDKQPAWAWRAARTAWAQSKTNDITFGASFWGNANDLKTSKLYNKLHFTVRIKDQWFFKK